MLIRFFTTLAGVVLLGGCVVGQHMYVVKDSWTHGGLI